MIVIFRSTFAHDTQVPPQASWCRGPSVTTRGHVWCFCSVKYTLPATLHRLLTPCYCHLFDRKVMCFSAEQRTSTYGCCDTKCSSWCTTTSLASMIPRSLANWTRMGYDQSGTYSFSRVCHNHCRITTTGARCLGQSIAGLYSAPLWPFAWENTRLSCCEWGVTFVLMWLSSLYCDMCVSFGLNLIYSSTVINYLSHGFAIQWTCPWGCCIFFPAV